MASTVPSTSLVSQEPLTRAWFIGFVGAQAPVAGSKSWENVLPATRSSPVPIPPATSTLPSARDTASEETLGKANPPVGAQVPEAGS
ncbi:MAG TPA: hypothetical protein VNA57_11905 [Acidimicrobiales bacterium]|nr:hypothetical protein [Acidimicrobiales bacterium]